MPVSRLVPAVVAGAAVVIVLLPVATRALSVRGVLDVPNERSSHARTTVRGGGLVTGAAIAIALVIGASPVSVAIAACVAAAAIVGGVEDFRGVSVLLRLVTQLAIGVGFLLATSHAAPVPLLALPVVLAFVVSYTNAFNFMDGINGVSAVTAAICGATFLAFAHRLGADDLALVGGAIAASAVAFLPFNFPSARVFLGDSGSYSFGMAIACASVLAWRAGIRLDAVLAPLAVYLADTSAAIVRRATRRERVSTPHREHVYQRLVQLGASHTQSTLIVGGFTLCTAALGIANHGQQAERFLIDVIVGAVVVLYLGLPRIANRYRMFA